MSITKTKRNQWAHAKRPTAGVRERAIATTVVAAANPVLLLSLCPIGCRSYSGATACSPPPPPPREKTLRHEPINETLDGSREVKATGVAGFVP